MNSELFQSSKKGQDKGSGSADLSQFVEMIFHSVAALVFAGFIVSLALFKDRETQLLKGSTARNLATFSCAFLGGSLLLGIGLALSNLKLYILIPLVLIAFWMISFSLVFAFKVLTRGLSSEDRILVSQLSGMKPNFKELEKIFEDPSRMPIGISMKDGKPVYIPIKQILEHSLTSGATGQGKTTLLKTKIHHFIRHNRPVIIIDPKGERKDVEDIKALCAKYGRESDFKLFSLSAPSESCYYDCLKVGDSQQKKSKLMTGLNLTHEYFGALADEFVGTILDCHKFLGRPLCLTELGGYIINPAKFSKLETTLRNLPDSNILESILERVSALRKMDYKELKGLSAQLSSLNALEISDLLNPSSTRPELDLVDTLRKGQVAYFQMNINGYSAIAKAIGKLIVQDLRLVSNMIQSGQTERNFDVALVSLDEMGSFVYLDFADYIKQVRSSGIGLDLLFQGTADVRQISPEFAEQIIGNTAAKIIFQQDIKEDVEAWSSMAGTKDTIIESFQTENSNVFGSQKTGAGNVHHGKTVVIDFDVIKRLSPGQAVFIDKKRHLNELIYVWNGELSEMKQLPPKQVKLKSDFVNIRKL